MVTLAIRILYFKNFLITENKLQTNGLKAYVEEFTERKSANPMFQNDVLISLFNKYEEYTLETLQSKHEKRLSFILCMFNL